MILSSSPNTDFSQELFEVKTVRAIDDALKARMLLVEEFEKNKFKTEQDTRQYEDKFFRIVLGACILHDLNEEERSYVLEYFGFKRKFSALIGVKNSIEDIAMSVNYVLRNIALGQMTKPIRDLVKRFSSSIMKEECGKLIVTLDNILKKFEESDGKPFADVPLIREISALLQPKELTNLSNWLKIRFLMKDGIRINYGGSLSEIKEKIALLKDAGLK